MINYLNKLGSYIFPYITLKSLRSRIFLIILIVGIVPCIMMRYGIMRNYEQRAVEQRTLTVQNQLKILADHLINEDYLNKTSSDVINAELEMLSNLYDGRVQIINSNLKIVKDTYDISEGKIIHSEEVIKCFMGESLSNYDAENGYIEMTTPIIDNKNLSDDVLEVMNNNNSSSAQVNQANRVKGVMLTSISSDSITGTMELLLSSKM